MPGNRRHIAPNIKQLVLRMNDDPEMTRTRIRELTGVSERTQYRIAALLRETGEVVRTPLVAGRPRKLDALDSAVSVHSNLGEELTHYVAVS
jgi:transposase